MRDIHASAPHHAEAGARRRRRRRCRYRPSSPPFSPTPLPPPPPPPAPSPVVMEVQSAAFIIPLAFLRPHAAQALLGSGTPLDHKSPGESDSQGQRQGARLPVVPPS
jgi:hypothetical protein